MGVGLSRGGEGEVSDDRPSLQQLHLETQVADPGLDQAAIGVERDLDTSWFLRGRASGRGPTSESEKRVTVQREAHFTLPRPACDLEHGEQASEVRYLVASLLSATSSVCVPARPPDP